jgi:hypothetical protein
VASCFSSHNSHATSPDELAGTGGGRSAAAINGIKPKLVANMVTSPLLTSLSAPSMGQAMVCLLRAVLRWTQLARQAVQK